ncbi:retrotransposon protein, putative, ty1-copia subclass [Tanacetum coccineum]
MILSPPLSANPPSVVGLGGFSTNMSFFCYFKNIGGNYESWETGVLGPVVLYGLDQGKRDLTHAKWSYQVGLKGEAKDVVSMANSKQVAREERMTVAGKSRGVSTSLQNKRYRYPFGETRRPFLTVISSCIRDDSTKYFDFAVIGSGVAGLRYALEVAKHGNVAKITKAEPHESNTNYAQGGVSVVLCPSDSVVCTEGPERIRELIAMGASFDHGEDENLHLAREGGHSHHKIVHTADVTGKEIERALLKAIEKDPNITVFNHHFAIDLLTSQVVLFISKVTLLASGGAGHIYPSTTNPPSHMVLGIAPVAIIDRQLPFEYTITSRSTDVVVPLPAAHAADSEEQVLSQWNAVYDAYNEVACLIVGTRVERFDLIQTFHASKQEEGKPVAAYVIQMKGYVDQLECLGYMLPQDLIVGLILNGLTKDFARFVRNYNMHNMGKTIGELHAMLIKYEKAKGKGKANGKGNDKQVYIPKPKNPKPSAKEHPTKDNTCHHCKEVGHWKRNGPVYLAKLLKKKKQVGFASSSGIFTIELFAFPNKSWVYDTGCGTHICITKQGFREARKLKQGALYLYVGNGVRAQVEAIGSYDLVLPNGLVICLDNCHYAPSITRVSKNNVFYFNAIPSNGIYEIDMHDLVPNVNSIYNVSTKRAKHNLDSTYLWHCRLAHISKMTRKSFPHRPERATYLLGIMHTDVCGPHRHVSRQGASYFITFTDDYCRYGYVYLLKHKHELTPPYIPQHNDVSERRNRTLLDMVRSMTNLTTLPLSFWDYVIESATRILNMVWGCEALVKRDTSDKLQQRSVKFVARYAEFFEKNLITQEVSRRAIDLEEIQYEDTSPSEFTSEIPMEVEGFEPPQEEVIPVCRSERTHPAPDRLCLNVEVEEHSLGDLNEPTSYKAAMLDSLSNKWIDAMNAEIQSMIDNMV